MTGYRLTSSIPAMMRSLSSCFDATRMWRRTERANLEKKPSMRLSQEPCLGVKVNSKRPAGRAASQAWVSLEIMRRMVVEDQLDRRTGRVSGIEKLEEFDELAAAVTLLDQGMDLPGEQINSGQQAERAMALVLIIARERRVGARHRRQIRCCGSDRLDSRLLVVGDDRHRLSRFLRLVLRLGSGLFQDLDLAIDAQNLRHLCSNSASRRSR